ncbi:hypothetical protein OK016_30205 [Vibrio chagasii]|nr:hypothetical protein [Vibrio chagasii]
MPFNGFSYRMYAQKLWTLTKRCGLCTFRDLLAIVQPRYVEVPIVAPKFGKQAVYLTYDCKFTSKADFVSLPVENT